MTLVLFIKIISNFSFVQDIYCGVYAYVFIISKTCTYIYCGDSWTLYNLALRPKPSYQESVI